MILEVNEINTYYGLSHVLQGVNLTLEQGRIVCLLGRNGMGKSTTLKTLMGMVKPKSGTVHFHETDITGWQPHKVAKAGIGYVPEERRIFPKLTVLDNLRMGIKEAAREIKGNEPWTEERVFKHFPRLKERSANKGANLSGGEQQMLSIARALMGNPDLLLVDEPTEGLAPIMVKEVRDVLAEINQTGVSILLVEHNLDVALSLADEVVLLGKGYIGFRGTVQDLKNNPEIKAKYLEV